MQGPTTSEGEARPPVTATELTGNAGYLLRDEIRADLFLRRVPLADGRGVTIGIPGGLFDYMHEAFREARTIAGDTVAKVAGLLDATWYKPGVYVRQDTDPRERVVLREGGAGSVVSDARLVSRDSVVPFAGTVVRLPEPGTWHLAEWPR